MSFHTAKNTFRRKAEKGITMIEYALIAAVVAVTIVGGFKFLAGSVNEKFTEIGTSIKNP